MLASPFAPRLALLLPLVLTQLAAPTRAQEGEVVEQAQLEAWTESIKREIEVLRGMKFKRPVAVSTANLKQFIGYVKERMEKDTSKEDLDAQELVAKMLGVIPVEMSLIGTYMEMIESQVGGFYDPNTESFCLMEQYGGDLARVVLAHELTHALDDQYYDIDGTLAKIEKNSDQSLAYHAVVEGSGTATQNAWLMTKLSEIDAKQLKDVGGIGTAGMEDAPPYLWKPMLGVYLKGAAFLVRSSSILAGSSKTPTATDVHIAFMRPPLSTEQILHPEKYWDAEKRDDPLPVKLNTEHLPEGWSVLAEDTLGELGLGFVVEPRAKRRGLTGMFQILSTKYTYPASEGWGGDRYVLLARGDSRLLLLRTLWDTDADREEFAQELELHKPHLIEALKSLAGDAGGVQMRTLKNEGNEWTLGLGMGVSDTDFRAVLAGLLP